MLTSDELNFRLARMREAGLHTYLIKPVKRVELLEKIRLLLNGGGVAKSLPGPADTATAPVDTRPLRILLAEDAPDNRFLIRAYLKKLPYQIDIAENGRVAIDKFKALRPDLVLMDVQMPDIDGLAATRVIRQWESAQGLPATPIIALTASVLEDDVRRSLAAGCDEHVSKPVKKPVLLAAIRRATAARRPEVGAEFDQPDARGLATRGRGGTDGNAARLETASVERFNLQRRRFDTLDAAGIDVYAVRRRDEWRASAVGAEMMLHRTAFEGVGGEVGLRRGQPQVFARHAPVQIAAHRADRAVALHHLFQITLDFEPVASAMASAAMSHGRTS